MWIQDQILLQNQLNTTRIERDSILASVSNIDGEPLTDIKGIGEGTQKILKENGIKNKSQLLTLSETQVKEIITNPISQKGVLNFISENKEKWLSEQLAQKDLLIEQK